MRHMIEHLFGQGNDASEVYLDRARNRLMTIR
jgi:hypothetical protein